MHRLGLSLLTAALLTGLLLAGGGKLLGEDATNQVKIETDLPRRVGGTLGTTVTDYYVHNYSDRAVVVTVYNSSATNVQGPFTVPPNGRYHIGFIDFSERNRYYAIKGARYE